MNSAALLMTAMLVGQQPQFQRGTTQQQWNKEMQVAVTDLAGDVQTLRDTLKARADETVEVGKLIQQELDRNSDDVEVLRQKVNSLSARMAAKDDAAPKQEPMPAGAALIGFGLLISVIGILIVNCVRLWFDMRMQRLVLGLIEVRQPLGPLENVSENGTRQIPDPAIR